MSILERVAGRLARGRGRQPKRRVVYTCLFGYSEPFADYDYDDRNVDYVCFTDDPDLTSSIWTIVHVDNPLLDRARLSKRFKALAHLVLPQYESSIYLDNTIRLKQPPSRLFEMFGGHEMAMLWHPQRDCVYDEAREVLALGYDKPDIVNAQMDFYRRLGYPEHNGLNKAGFLMRRHASEAVARTCLEWHGQVLRHSLRDQLSWNVCAWMTGLSFHTIKKDFYDNDLLSWPVVPGRIRLPRDFDDETYLALHADVRAAGINPRKHYLLFGAKERRAYLAR